MQIELTPAQEMRIQYAMFTLDEWTKIASAVLRSEKLDGEEKSVLLEKFPSASLPSDLKLF